jgi:protein-tyrosine phosphatase
MNLIRPWLYIGRLRDTQDLLGLSINEISAMLQLEADIRQPGIESLYLPVVDDALIPPADWQRGVSFLRDQKALGNIILVACGAGQNRSVCFAAAALREEEGLGLLDALAAIKQRHPIARPHPKVWESLCRYYGEPVSVHAMVKIAWVA